MMSPYVSVTSVSTTIDISPSLISCGQSNALIKSNILSHNSVFSSIGFPPAVDLNFQLKNCVFMFKCVD